MFTTSFALLCLINIFLQNSRIKIDELETRQLSIHRYSRTTILFLIFGSKMFPMDLQSRKIEFIQEFLKIQNEEVISKLEQIVNTEKASRDSEEIKPMSVEQFRQRIDTSMEDSKNGRVIETSTLKAKVEKWA